MAISMIKKDEKQTNVPAQRKGKKERKASDDKDTDLYTDHTEIPVRCSKGRQSRCSLTRH